MRAIFTTLLIGTTLSRVPSRIVMLHDPIDPDLPCPWCKAATLEDDSDCPSCGRRFG